MILCPNIQLRSNSVTGSREALLVAACHLDTTVTGVVVILAGLLTGQQFFLWRKMLSQTSLPRENIKQLLYTEVLICVFNPLLSHQRWFLSSTNNKSGTNSKWSRIQFPKCAWVLGLGEKEREKQCKWEGKMGGKEVLGGKDNILQRAPGCGGDGRHPAASVLNAEPPRHHVLCTICCRQSQTLITTEYRVGAWITHEGWVLGGKTLPSDPSELNTNSWQFSFELYW